MAAHTQHDNAARNVRDSPGRRRVWLRFLAYYIPTALALALLGFWFVTSQAAEERKLTAAEERSTVLLERQFFQDQIGAMAEDVRFLAQLAAGCMEDMGEDACRERLGETLLLFAREQRNYSPIILLDAAGVELLRVDETPAGAALASEAELRIRGASPYYWQALKYRRQVWFSSIETNVSGRPLLRVSKAVLDNSGRMLGVVALTYDASIIFEIIARRELDSKGWHYLFRGTGEQIRAPALGSTATVDDMGALFSRLGDTPSGTSGSLAVEQGLFTYEAVCPSSPLIDVPGRPVPLKLEECWIIVSHVPWSAIGPAWIAYAPWVGGAGLLLLAAAFWTWVRSTESRRQAEKSLRESEQLLRDVVEAAGEFIWEVDAKYRFIYVSDRVRDMLGYEPEELLGNTPELLNPPGKDEEYKALFIKALKEKTQHRHLELQAVTKSGQLRHHIVSVVPVLDDSGRAVGMRGASLDITKRKVAEEKLRESEVRLRDVLEAADEIFWEMDSELRFTHISDRIRDVLGYEPGEVLGRTPIMLMPEENADEYKAHFEKLLRTKLPFKGLELLAGLKGGGFRYHEVSATPVVDDSGRAVGIRGATRDITKRKVAEEKLRESEQKARAMLEASHDAMVVVDARGRIQFWNHAAQRMFGYTEAEALGMDVHDMVAEPGDYAKALEGMSEFAKTGNGPIVGNIQEYMALRKDGSVFPVEHAVASFRVRDEWYAVGSVRDKTEQKKAEAELRRLATTDSLTGIANRRHFIGRCAEELERHRRYGAPVSLVMIDVDDFKKINDTWGHGVGDQVLKAVADQMGVILRDVDLYGRIGGEEFAVLLPGTGMDGAAEAAERLRQELENVCFTMDEAQVNVTLSLGVSALQGKEDTLEALFKRADDALYDAKNTGRNKVVVKA